MEEDNPMMRSVLRVHGRRTLIGLAMLTAAAWPSVAETFTKYTATLLLRDLTPMSAFCDDMFEIELNDPDIEGAGSVTLVVTCTTGDVETVILPEVGGITGVFKTTVVLKRDPVQVENGIISTVDEAIFRTEYLDTFNDQGQEQLIGVEQQVFCPPCTEGPVLSVYDPDVPVVDPICSGCSVSFQVKITNLGCARLDGAATVDPPFIIKSGATYSIPPQSVHTIGLEFSPTAAGVFTRTLTLTGGGGATVELTAEAVNPAPVIHVDPTSIDFGTVNVGQSGTATITITNTACGVLSGTASVSPPFYIDGSADYSVSCGGEARITVKFTPERYGTYSDVVVITGGGGAEVPVTGFGQGKTDFVHVIAARPHPEFGFPTIKADVIVDTDAGHACELGLDDFVLTEDGVDQSVTSFTCGQTRVADIVVLFDDSGSISPIMQEMQDVVHEFVDTIAAEPTFTARYGIMRITANPPEVWQDLTADIGLFHERLEALGNGLASEMVAGGIVNALRDMTFLPATRKVFLVVTDEGAQGANYAQAVQQVNDAGGSIYIISIVDTVFQDITAQTGGLWQDIAAPDTAALIAHIREHATGVYSLTYDTEHFCADGTERNVCVTATDPIHGPDDDCKFYTAPNSFDATLLSFDVDSTTYPITATALVDVTSPEAEQCSLSQSHFAVFESGVNQPVSTATCVGPGQYEVVYRPTNTCYQARLRNVRIRIDNPGDCSTNVLAQYYEPSYFVFHSVSATVQPSASFPTVTVRIDEIAAPGTHCGYGALDFSIIEDGAQQVIESATCSGGRYTFTYVSTNPYADGAVRQVQVISPNRGTCQAVLSRAYNEPCQPWHPRIIHIDKNSTANNPDGRAWATAFQTLQAGLDEAARYFCGSEVWVADGVYDEPRDKLLFGERPGSVQLPANVPVYGGFSGNETIRDARNWETRVTVIDGATARDGAPAYHVVVGNTGAVLDGFTIRGGVATGGAGTVGEDPNDCGGGVYVVGGSMDIAHCVITECEALVGGGVYTSETFLSLTQCDVFQNEATYGGGMYFYGGIVTGADCGVHDNTALQGAGTANVSSSASYVDCAWSNNEATSDGGALHNVQADLIVLDSHFEGNRSGGLGGAAFTRECVAEFTQCVFATNAAGTDGGACYNNASETHFDTCTFTGNNAGRNYGALAHISHTSTDTVAGCAFDGNESRNHGGALGLGTKKVRIERSSFFRNVAGGSGGAVFMGQGVTTLDMVNVLIAWNTADDSGAGVHTGANASAMNCTIADNEAGAVNAWYYTGTVAPRIINSILWQSSGLALGRGAGTPEATIEFSDVRGLSGGTGNLDVDPGFRNTANDDFRLQPSSPCRNAGTSSNAPTDDLLLNPRPRRGSSWPPAWSRCHSCSKQGLGASSLGMWSSPWTTYSWEARRRRTRLRCPMLVYWRTVSTP